MSDTDAFQRFLERHAKDLARIAHATQGEWKADDVRQEAWLLAFDLGDKRGYPFDLDAPEDASLLMRCLYNHCVKYGELVLRRADKLDHAAPGDDQRENHWLHDRLVADGGAHPASLLEAAQSIAPEPDAPHLYHSPAAGWLALVALAGNRLTDLADYLLISPSWCGRCLRRALWQANTQSPLPVPQVEGAPDDLLRPWRSFRLPARPPPVPCDRQPALDFWSRPPDPACGQRWLL